MQYLRLSYTGLLIYIYRLTFCIHYLLT